MTPHGVVLDEAFPDDDGLSVEGESKPFRLRPVDPANPPKLGREQILRHQVIPPVADIVIPVGLIGDLPDEELVLVNRKDRRRRGKR